MPQEHMSQGSKNLKAPKGSEGRWVGLSRELQGEISPSPNTIVSHCITQHRFIFLLRYRTLTRNSGEKEVNNVHVGFAFYTHSVCSL